jgi:hypothetical protein
MKSIYEVESALRHSKRPMTVELITMWHRTLEHISEEMHQLDRKVSQARVETQKKG